MATADVVHVDPSIALRRRTGREAEVVVFKDVVVSCKGEVWRGPQRLVDGGGAAYDGCSYNEGTCVWDSAASHVSKRPYCLASGMCVPRAPGPAERSNVSCRESTPTCLEEPGVVAGPLESIVVLTQPQWGAYYHFLIDGLTRLAWIHLQHRALLQDDETYFHTGLVSEMGQAWARLAGIRTTAQASRVLDGWWKARTAYYPPSNACMNLKRGTDLTAVEVTREKVHNNMQVAGLLPPLSAWRKLCLFVLRDPRTSTARAVANQKTVRNELKAMLNFSGWTVRTFSDYPRAPSATETCSLFFQADLIVGPHGAGFANILCSRPGTPLVEFRPGTRPWDYELLTLKMGLSYIEMPFPTMGQNDQFTVDRAELRKYVAIALGKLPAPAEPPSPVATAAAPASTTVPPVEMTSAALAAIAGTEVSAPTPAATTLPPVETTSAAPSAGGGLRVATPTPAVTTTVPPVELTSAAPSAGAGFRVAAPTPAATTLHRIEITSVSPSAGAGLRVAAPAPAATTTLPPVELTSTAPSARAARGVAAPTTTVAAAESTLAVDVPAASARAQARSAATAAEPAGPAAPLPAAAAALGAAATPAADSAAKTPAVASSAAVAGPAPDETSAAAPPELAQATRAAATGPAAATATAVTWDDFFGTPPASGPDLGAAREEPQETTTRQTAKLLSAAALADAGAAGAPATAALEAAPMSFVDPLAVSGASLRRQAFGPTEFVAGLSMTVAVALMTRASCRHFCRGCICGRRGGGAGGHQPLR